MGYSQLHAGRGQQRVGRTSRQGSRPVQEPLASLLASSAKQASERARFIACRHMLEMITLARARVCVCAVDDRLPRASESSSSSMSRLSAPTRTARRRGLARRYHATRHRYEPPLEQPMPVPEAMKPRGTACYSRCDRSFGSIGQGREGRARGVPRCDHPPPGPIVRPRGSNDHQLGRRRAQLALRSGLPPACRVQPAQRTAARPILPCHAHSIAPWHSRPCSLVVFARP